MGCRRLNELVFFKKAGQIKNKLAISLIVAMLIAAISPIVFADADLITVTFDPTGTVAIETRPDTASFGEVVFSSANNYPTEGGIDTSYTVWNNGTVGADIYIFSNATTDSSELALANGGSPGLSEYSLDVTGSNSTQITDTNASWLDNLPASASVTYGLNLDLGGGTQNWAAQTTRIDITATVNS
jgi:hypothetical protein